MTNWKYNVYFVEITDEQDSDTLDVRKIVKILFDRLSLLREEIRKKDKDPDSMLKGFGGLDFIMDELQYFDFDVGVDDQVERFDEIMNELYDFADYHYVWINTMDEDMKGIGKP
jgi:hypothetical protein